VFYYSPNNYMWSSALTLSMMAGGQLNQIDRRLSPLRDGDPDIDDWTKASDSAAAQQEEHAADDLRRGFARSAGERFLRASTRARSQPIRAHMRPEHNNVGDVGCVGRRPTIGSAYAFWILGARCRRSALDEQLNALRRRSVYSVATWCAHPAGTAALTSACMPIDMSVVLSILSQARGSPIPGSDESLEVKP
jgi:hypothetical protein